ncbi:unnamed protein product [Penicillium egyptiacum]|uniref:Zn(2)-C6 fungal-type domain-containing protein n=1 Tax=Penicillium egyptiacum TaxID=1303716 RepID=A0A9W4P5Y1_9EURO|nr:unnamed protein product [Penicillium egyptiacum]
MTSPLLNFDRTGETPHSKATQGMALTCPSEMQDGRALWRSRFGCRNCKLRKLKVGPRLPILRFLADGASLAYPCDENKPQCKRCGSFGVLCNFMSNIPDLQPVAADTGRPLVVRGKAQLQPPLTNAVLDIWLIDILSIKRKVSRFYNPVSWTNLHREFSHINPVLLDIMESRLSIMGLSTANIWFTVPFLNARLSLTYDRHLNGSLGCRRTVEECYHWSQSTVLLDKRLREPIEDKDKDQSGVLRLLWLS